MHVPPGDEFLVPDLRCFLPDFMEKHTRFGSIEALIEASPVAELWKTDRLQAWQSGAFQAFVLQHTEFESTAAFALAATMDFIRRTGGW